MQPGSVQILATSSRAQPGSTVNFPALGFIGCHVEFKSHVEGTVEALCDAWAPTGWLSKRREGSSIAYRAMDLSIPHPPSP